MPLNIFLNEASSISGFVERYWDPEDNRPGLSMAAPIVTRDMAEEISSLVAAVSKAQSDAEKEGRTGAVERGVSLRARAWIREMQHLLSWAHIRETTAGRDGFTGNLSDANREYLKGRKNAGKLAEWVMHYKAIATVNDTLLRNVPGYSPSMISEGDRLMRQLLQTRPGRPKASEARRNALTLRRQLTHVLADRVRRVRSAARFVFRNHPEIRRLATSDFERRRRRRNRGEAR